MAGFATVTLPPAGVNRYLLARRQSHDWLPAAYNALSALLIPSRDRC